MSETPDVEVLRVSPVKWIGVLLACVAFVAIGIFLLTHKRPGQSNLVPWACILFFGFGSLLALLQLIPGASYLRLAPDGFVISSTWRTRNYCWSDISEFGVTSVPSGIVKREIVGFNFSSTSQHPDRNSHATNFSVSVCGYEAGLADNYGIGCQALADLLNERLRQARANSIGL